MSSPSTSNKSCWCVCPIPEARHASLKKPSWPLVTAVWARLPQDAEDNLEAKVAKEGSSSGKECPPVMSGAGGLELRQRGQERSERYMEATALMFAQSSHDSETASHSSSLGRMYVDKMQFSGLHGL
jgi:hypothetical protein